MSSSQLKANKVEENERFDDIEGVNTLGLPVFKKQNKKQLIEQIHQLEDAVGSYKKSLADLVKDHKVLNDSYVDELNKNGKIENSINELIGRDNIVDEEDEEHQRKTQSGLLCVNCLDLKEIQAIHKLLQQDVFDKSISKKIKASKIEFCNIGNVADLDDVDFIDLQIDNLHNNLPVTEKLSDIDKNEVVDMLNCMLDENEDKIQLVPQKPHHGTQKLVNLGSILKDEKKKLTIEIIEDDDDDVNHTPDIQHHKRPPRPLKPTQQESSGSQRKTVHKAHDPIIGEQVDLNKKFSNSMNLSKDMFQSTNGENIDEQEEIDQFEEGKSIDMDLDIQLGKQETEVENPDADLEKEFANQMKSVGVDLKALQSDDEEDDDNPIDSPKVVINV